MDKYGSHPNRKRLRKDELLKLYIIALERAKAERDEASITAIMSLIAQLEGGRGGGSRPSDRA